LTNPFSQQHNNQKRDQLLQTAEVHRPHIYRRVNRKLSTHIGTHKADHKLLPVKAKTALREERVTAAALGAGAQGCMTNKKHISLSAEQLQIH